MNQHNFILTSDQKCYCFGNNDSGQLGLGDGETRFALTSFRFPSYVPATSLIKKIIVSFINSFFSTSDGRFYFCGVKNSNTHNVIPVEFKSPSGRIRRIVCGAWHTFIVTSDRKCFWFGYIDNKNPTFVPIEFKSPSAFIKNVSCGVDYNFILTSDGKCFCFGKNSRGELGLGDKIQRETPVEFKLQNGSYIKKVLCGIEHTFLLTGDQKWFCFGCNESGQLGLGDVEDRLFPVEFKLPGEHSPIKKIFIGARHSFLLTMDQKCFCFGSNGFYQLGLGDHYDRISPEEFTIFRKAKDHKEEKKEETIEIKKTSCNHNFVETVKSQRKRCEHCGLWEPKELEQANKKQKIENATIKNIICSARCTFISTVEDKLYCFGDNMCGQLGLGDDAARIFPVELKPLSGYIKYMGKNRAKFFDWKILKCLLVAQKKNYDSLWHKLPTDVIDRIFRAL